MTRAKARGSVRGAVITTARRARSLDADARNKRYLWTMGVRVACFLGGVVAPHPWNWVSFIGAAVIPPMAVMLANAVDLRQDPPASDDEAPDRPALTAGGIVPGSVED